LHRIGVERIAARLDAIADEHDGLPLVLCCYEKLAADCHRARAAEWLGEQTGVAPPEIGSMFAKADERISVVCYEVPDREEAVR
jgi:hypothetical protein